MPCLKGVALYFRWPSSCKALPDEIRRAVESHLGRLWVRLSEREVGGGTTADFRLNLDDWTLRYAIDLGAHTVIVREARSAPARWRAWSPVVAA